MHRRKFLKSGVALSGVLALRATLARAQSKPLAYADMHSHIGILGGRADVREAMTKNGMLVVVRKIVADGPVIRRIPGKGVQQVREAAAGELSSRFRTAFERIREEHKAQNVIEIVDAETLKRVKAGSEPAVVLAAEGADFLEGDLTRLEAARRQGLVHLQLVHYRISDVGDISTARPTHNGLTAFGKDVVRACNRLGILIDVAHATSDGIAHALELSMKPIIYSHGHVTASSPFWTYGVTRARAIHAPLAKRIAEKGGVIGIWPLGSQFSSLDAFARALIETAETVGPAHVGIGSDMFGLGGSSVLPGYEQFPQLQELLATRGLKDDDVTNIMGGNYLRLLSETLSI